MNGYQEISLSQIKPSPRNPRRRCDPKQLAELAASIKAKGVIEPIIVRPIAAAKGAPGHWEIVAGERRFRAAGQAGLTEIPAIVRDLTEDEAYDLMIVENLQRSDLTDREEADSFKAYLELHKGEEGLLALAEKTGISPAYIRSRVRVLELPAKVLKAWAAGDLAFGHLQQLLRVSRARKEKLAEVVDELMERLDDDWDGPMTVQELARKIDGQAPELKSAFFKTAELCKACSANSMVQRDLFGVEANGARCMNPTCFKKHQGDWLAANWKTSAAAKQIGTNGFIFSEDRRSETVHDFYDYSEQPGAKCRKCPHFVTVLELSGKVYHEKACAGDLNCFNAVTRARTAKEKQTGERDPEAPRASWHGEYFRDKFIRPRIAAGVGELDFPVSDGLVLLLVAAVQAKGPYAVDEAVEKALGVKEGRGRRSCEPVIEAILKAKGETLKKAARAIVLWIVQDGQNVDRGFTGDGFGTGNRAAVARFLGVDLAKEYAVDADYLAKKTRAEVLAFVRKFNLFPAASVEKMKKKDLDKAVLALGDKLVGKCPDEILKVKK